MTQAVHGAGWNSIGLGAAGVTGVAVATFASLGRLRYRSLVEYEAMAPLAARCERLLRRTEPGR